METSKLTELADEIEDEHLRQKTVQLIDNFELSNDNFDYSKSDLEKIPSWIGGHHYYEGGLIEHIYSVTKLCIKLSDHFLEVYDDIDIDRDKLIAASLLHDLAKMYIIENMSSFRDCNLEHDVWMCCELYSKGFPEKVIEIVAEHGGETRQAAPQSKEARILHQADSLDAQLLQEEIEDGIIELI